MEKNVRVVDNTDMQEAEKKKSLPEVKQPEYFFWGAFVLAGILFLFPEGKVTTEPKQQTAAVYVASIDPYETVSLEAKAAVVLDTRTKRILFEHNANVALPLASLTKIMTATTALSLVPETTVVPISDEALREEGDAGLVSGDEWLLRDLLALTLLESSNDGARAVAETAGAVALGSPSPADGRAFFIEQMNRAARVLSLQTLSFKNESGLDMSPSIAGGYGGAYDVAALFARALAAYPAIFEPTRWDKTVLSGNGENGFSARNTNRETGKFPLLIASKTGYTDLAGGNLALAFDAGFNRPIIIVVLGSSYEGRFADAEKLVWSTLEYLQSR
jgi:D-alanyl-D-alanine carboxypeptidase